MSINARKKMINGAVGLLSLVIVIIIAFPIIWMVRTSLLQTVFVYESPPVLLFKPTVDAYINVFTRQNYSLRFFNSAVISISTTIVSLFVGAMASYGISRFPLPFGKQAPIGFLFLRMLPSISTLVPVFLMFTSLKLIDTYHGLTALYITGAVPTVIWMMIGFYKGLPIEVEESAYIDGCGPFETFLKIVTPMTTPALAALGILTFTGAWNEFMMAIILTRRNVITLPPGIKFLMSQSDLSWDLISAAGTLVSLPILLLCLFAQKYFVSGLSLGAVKG